MIEVSRVPADAALLEAFTALASRAAAAILAVAPADLAVMEKRDHSPVTAADLASEGVILEGLGKLLPGVPIVSEESPSARPPGVSLNECVLVDPLDGTRELVAGRDEFTVNIALIRRGVPYLGVIAAPARGLFWRGIVGQGAERLADQTGVRTPIRTRARPVGGTVALVSRSHLDPATEDYLARANVAEKRPCGSSLKFCHLAEGIADLYPRLGPTSEWDVAAGHAVLVAAGGSVTDPRGEPLAYGRSRDFRIPAFIARGDSALPIAP